MDLGSGAWLERWAAASWPAAEVRQSSGWLLRHTPGVRRRRSNSALPPAPADSPQDTIAVVEAFYRERGLPVVVQVSPAEQHAALDAALADRGYDTDRPTLVLTAPLSQVTAATDGPPATVTVAERLTDQWRVAFDPNGDNAAVCDQVLARIPMPAGFATAVLDGEPAGIGLLTAGEGWVGVYCMATVAQHRRKGVATAILHAGARWAASRGAERAYLQVEQDNAGARALYRTAGFTLSHRYHYRTAS
ncbi:GNAT family N-acetyltransferase [Actinomycetes bacterium KLBMP 9797]